jgi:hypothetical protein
MLLHSAQCPLVIAPYANCIRSLNFEIALKALREATVVPA